MRRTVHQCQCTKLLNQPAALFENGGTESVYRQALLFQNIRIAKETDRELSCRQPIRTLAKITKQGYVHLAEKPPDERRSKFRMIIEEPCVACARPGFADISHLDLAFPFRVQQIPIRFKFLNIDEFRVVVDSSVGRRADIVEYVLAFWIRVLVCL